MRNIAENHTGMADALAVALDEHAAAGRTAFVSGGTEISYARLRDEVLAGLGALTDAGLRPGAVVGMLTGKSPRSLASFLSLMLAGACPGFLDPRLPDDKIIDQARAVGMAAVVADEDRAASLSGRGLPTLDPAAGSPAERPVLGPRDPALMLFTSGSTGRPKGVLLSHRNLLVNAAGVVAQTRLTTSDRLLHIMPVHHTNGLNNQVLAPLLAGATVFLMDRFKPADAVDAVRVHQPTYVTGVPTMYLRMLEHIADGESFPSLRFVRCGSAPITAHQQAAIERRFGVPVVLSYGMSEATCTSTMNPVEEPRLGSVGTALAGQRIRIAVPGSTRAMDVGEEGEILIGGEAVMSGYVGTDAADPVEDGWLHTGDLGRLDADGYLTITGRLKDTIIRGGENIVPSDIEQVLVTHPAVLDCCVVGRPHPDLGEVPVAFVSTTGEGEVPADDLRSWIAERLSRMYVPAEVRVLDQLPVNGLGKIDRTSLRSLARAGT
ncbi:class I adenylate-forming enzyme family protein [Streptomyces sp. TP-A0874]|uniref:class I adenylate-forming enzyme family protein n=1 Tax=Streptomyces sp. TP-A0874 TaxID=549819 RepID=UPI000B0E27B8|nr:class I adenylate-forming enzyme family protein [Streptomyces sp. TP-A0874]